MDKHGVEKWAVFNPLYLLGIFLIGSLFLSGCSKVTIDELGLVSQVNMQFEENQAHGLNNGLLPQIEPGNNAGGGAQSAGCIACK